MMIHDLPASLGFRQSRSWPDRGRLAPSTSRGKTAGIVGYGAIGRECARQLQALGMRIVCAKADPAARADTHFNAWPGTGDPEGSILGDLVRLRPDRGPPRRERPHRRHGAEHAGHPRDHRRRPACARQAGARLIIVSRGGIVDEPALDAALRTGRLAGAHGGLLRAGAAAPGRSALRDPQPAHDPARVRAARRPRRRVPRGSWARTCRRLQGRRTPAQPSRHIPVEDIMKITGLTTRVIEIDPRPRYKDGVVPAGRPTTWQFPLLTVHTDDGHGGLQHRASVRTATASRSSSRCTRCIRGRSSAPTRCASEELWQSIWRKQRHLYHQRDSLLGVIDVAVWDIKGKALGAPIAALLGQFRDRMPCYATARSEHYTAEEIFEEARAVRDGGVPRLQGAAARRRRAGRAAPPRRAGGGRRRLQAHGRPAAGYNLSRGARRRSRTRRARVLLVRGTHPRPPHHGPRAARHAT